MSTTVIELGRVRYTNIAQPPAAAAEPKRHTNEAHHLIRHPATECKQNTTKVCFLCAKKRYVNRNTVLREPSDPSTSLRKGSIPVKKNVRKPMPGLDVKGEINRA